MKKYIIPSICINPMIFAMNFLAGSMDKHDEVSTSGALSNHSSFEEDDTDLSKGKSFWDDDNY